MENTLVIIKPDAVAAGHTEEIVRMIEVAGLTIEWWDKIRPSRELIEAHYAEHVGKPFYEDLCTFMTGGNVVYLLVEGEDAVQRMRDLAGTTDPKGWKPGTIRHRFGTSISRNAVHASDSVAACDRELKAYMNDGESD